MTYCHWYLQGNNKLNLCCLECAMMASIDVRRYMVHMLCYECFATSTLVVLNSSLLFFHCFSCPLDTMRSVQAISFKTKPSTIKGPNVSQPEDKIDINGQFVAIVVFKLLILYRMCIYIYIKVSADLNIEKQIERSGVISINITKDFWLWLHGVFGPL